MPIKFLLVNQAFYPDCAATAQYLTDLAVELAAAGHEVRVLAGRQNYAEPGTVFAARETYRGIDVVRVNTLGFGKSTKAGRILDALYLNLAFAVRLLSLPRPDRVIALTSPPLVAWTACLYARIRRIPFIYWVMDIHPDEAVEAGWIERGSPAERVLRSALKFVLRYSAKIIVLDRFMKARLLDHGASAEKAAVCPLWFLGEVGPVSSHTNPFRVQHGLNGKFIVMYSGNHSVCHPMETLLKAALALREDSGIVFLFIGGGERVKEIRAFREKHGLSNILQLPYQPRSELKYSLSAADLHAVVMGDAYAGIVHPSKIYGILATGRPFVYVGPEESHITDLVSTYGIGYRIPHGAVDRFVETIRTVRALSETERNAVREKEQSLADGKFSRKTLCGQLIKSVTGEEFIP